MIKPVVSIIIAAYNSEKTLQRALESVINQTFQEWECIIVDGLSQDKTMEIVKKYATIDSRIRYISERDNGIYDAFNKGWKMAYGEWIYYLGSDDWLTKSSFTDFFKDGKSYSTDVGIVIGNVNRMTRAGKERLVVAKGFKGSHQGMITRKRVIEEMRGFNEAYKLLADAELKFRIRNHGYKVENIYTTIANISSGGASDKWKNQIEMAKERKKIYLLDPNIKYPKAIIAKKIVCSALSIIFSKLKKIC